MLIGRTVLAEYGNNRTYRIDGIEWEKCPADTFETRDGPVKFCDYFQKTYNKKITDLKQPLIISRDKKTKRDNYFIPSLMLMTGLEDEEKANFKVMQAVS